MKRSSLALQFEELGAHMIVYRDWSIPGTFATVGEEADKVRRDVGLADASWIVKFCLHRDGKLPELPESARLWILTPLRQLITCDPELREDVLQRFGSIRQQHRNVLDPLPGVFDVTHLYSDLLLAGPKARATLEAMTTLNLDNESFPNHSCAGVFVAKMQAIVMRQDLHEVPAYHLLVNVQYSQNLWATILRAGQRDHITPFGFHTLRLLAEPRGNSLHKATDQFDHTM